MDNSRIGTSPMEFSRRSVIRAAPGLAAAALLPSGVAQAQTAASQAAAPLAVDSAAAEPTHFEQPPPDRVREVVGASHARLERVKELVDAQPALANAAWNWGFGDWETPLGAASHVGNRAIAEYLLSMGARPDIFTAAMMGWLDALKALLAADPKLAETKGPHGITLRAHARQGGDAAQATLAYLETIEASDRAPKSAPIDPAEKERFTGRFELTGGAQRIVTVECKKEMLSILPEGGFSRNLVRLGDREFHPVGTPQVRLVFTGDGSAVDRIQISDGPDRWTAVRAR